MEEVDNIKWKIKWQTEWNNPRRQARNKLRIKGGTQKDPEEGV